MYIGLSYPTITGMRYLVVLGFLIITPLIGGLYGAIYDQLTYSISPEFFKMRFHHLGYNGDENTRWLVAKIGFINTWGIGLVLGAILSLAGLIHETAKKHIRYTIQSFFIPIVFAILFSFLGYIMPQTEANLPNISDPAAFLCVERMNNYSKVGGIIGAIFGIGWQLYNYKRKAKP